MILRPTPIADARIVEMDPHTDERGFFARAWCREEIRQAGIDVEMVQASDLQFIRRDALVESIRAIASLIVVMDENRFLESLLPKCERRLGKRGLYGGTGGMAPGEFAHAMLWVLSFSDRAHDLLDIARRASLDFSLIARAASALESAGLVRTAEPKAAGWSNLT